MFYCVLLCYNIYNEVIKYINIKRTAHLAAKKEIKLFVIRIKLDVKLITLFSKTISTNFYLMFAIYRSVKSTTINRFYPFELIIFLKSETINQKIFDQIAPDSREFQFFCG